MNYHYIEKGKGQAFVMLHGNNENSAYFSNQIHYFSKYYRVIALDTRGHGLTPRGDKPFTLNQFVEDLKVFLDMKKLHKIILLGFSDGANIALLFSLKYPEYVDKLILNGGNLYPAGVKFSIQAPTILKMNLLKIISKFNSEYIPALEMAKIMTEEPHIHPSRLFSIKCPTLIVAGTNDMIKRAHTMLIRICIPHSHICLIKGGHYIAKKNSSFFNTKIAQFLSIY